MTLWCARCSAARVQCRCRTSAALCAPVSAMQGWRQSWGLRQRRMRPLGREGGCHPLPSLFFGSTEKQDVRDLPGLPRSRDPGEGELAVYEPGWGTKGRCWVGPGVGRWGESIYGWVKAEGHRFQ